jgi:hypothetical protein
MVMIFLVTAGIVFVLVGILTLKTAYDIRKKGRE